MPQSVNQLLRSAHKHKQLGEIRQAETIYKHILARFPKNRKAIQGYNEIQTPPKIEVDELIRLYNQGKCTETVRIGEQLREDFPNASILYQILGAASFSLGNDFYTLKYYRTLLRLEPKNTDALNNIGMIFYKNGDLEKAVENYQDAIKNEPNFANAHFNLGNAFRKLGKFKEAIESYKYCLKLDPQDTETFIMYSKSLKEYGLLKEASLNYKKILVTNPELEHIRAELYQLESEIIEIDTTIEHYQTKSEKQLKPADKIFFTGKVYCKRGYVDAAIDYYEKALKLEPNMALAHFSIAELLSAKGNFNATIKHLEKAIEIVPDSAAFYYNLGHALKESGKPKAAIRNCKKAIHLAPKLAKAFDLIGSIHRENGDLDAALENYSQAIKINPDFAGAHNNIGIIHLEKAEISAAKSSHHAAMEIEPKNPLYCFNMANVFTVTGDQESAMKYYKDTLNLQPGHDLAAWNLAICYLTKEDFQNGWYNYDLRWKTMKDNGAYLPTGKPMWSPGRKERVLLWAEQGIGDEVMFASIIPDLYNLCSKLIVLVDERLIPIYRRSFPRNIDFRPRNELVQEKEYDTHIPIGSLPKYLRQNITKFQSISRGWLTSDVVKSDYLKEKLLADGSEVLIGISWSSTNPREGAQNKVMTLYQIASRLHGPKVKLINLQYGDVTPEINDLKEKTQIEVVQVPEVDIMNDIDGLAALITACDRVVSISNFTIHLTGALGKKAHVLLPYISDWRWGTRPSQSYWYNSVQIHRKTKNADWDTVLDQLLT